MLTKQWSGLTRLCFAPHYADGRLANCHDNTQDRTGKPYQDLSPYMDLHTFRSHAHRIEIEGKSIKENEELSMKIGSPCTSIPEHVIRPLTKIPFYDFTLRAPAEPVTFLEYFYGLDWEVPDHGLLHGNGRNPCRFPEEMEPEEQIIPGENEPTQ